jgi:hypothetical protein
VGYQVIIKLRLGFGLTRDVNREGDQTVYDLKQFDILETVEKCEQDYVTVFS